MSAFSVENPHDDKTFENDTRFEWGVEVGVVTTFMLRLFVPHEFDMTKQNSSIFQNLRYREVLVRTSSGGFEPILFVNTISSLNLFWLDF